MIGQAERVLELKRLENAERTKKSSKIIAFTSGKGGTGKTFISLNIAYALSKMKKRILYIDFDTNLSNANIMLNVVGKKTIYDFFSRKTLFPELIIKIDPNFHFVMGDSGKLNYEFPKEEMIINLFNQLISLESQYDYIILDTSSGATDGIISLISNANYNFVVTTPEPTAVMDAYVMLKLLKHNNYQGRKLLIINRCNTEEEGIETFNNLNTAVSHFLNEKIEFLGFVNFSPQVNKSIISQELLLKTDFSSKVSSQIILLAKHITEIQHMANIKHPRTRQI